MAASLCPRRTPPGRRAARWLGLARVGGAGLPRPTPNKSPSPACARRRAGTARESAARGGAGSRAPGAGPGPGWRRPSSIPSRWEGMVESSRRGSGSLCREQPVFRAPRLPSRACLSSLPPRPLPASCPPSRGSHSLAAFPAASAPGLSGGARSSLRLAPSRSLAASVPSCPAGRALVPGPGPAARCRRSEQLSSACSGFGTRCYESEASRAPRPAGSVGCAAGPETGISPQLASPSGGSLAPAVALLCLGGAGRVREGPSLSCACGISADMTAWGKFESLLLALLALCAGFLTAAQGKAGSPAARAMCEPSEARLASPGSVRRRVACRGAGLRRWLSTADAPRSRCRQAACIALCPPSSPAPHPRPPSPSLGLKRNASFSRHPPGAVGEKGATPSW